MIRIALLDSGVHATHPHLAGDPEAVDAAPFRVEDDYSDRTGHGTAVAAALHRLAPEAELLAVRVLDDELRCTTAALAEAIRRAAERGVEVINLSLGSTRADAREPLVEAVEHARDRGAVCVAAAHPRGRPLFPADLPGVLSATTHRSCPLADLFVVPGPLPRFLAHGLPRPIEGRAPTDNFFGPSFAAVHLSARVAGLLAEGAPAEVEALADRLQTASSGTWEAPPGT